MLLSAVVFVLTESPIFKIGRTLFREKSFEVVLNSFETSAQQSFSNLSRRLQVRSLRMCTVKNKTLQREFGFWEISFGSVS